MYQRCYRKPDLNIFSMYTVILFKGSPSSRGAVDIIEAWNHRHKDASRIHIEYYGSNELDIYYE